MASDVRFQNVWGDVDVALMIDLDADAYFYFRLQVFNSAGRGPPGEWRLGKTSSYGSETSNCNSFLLSGSDFKKTFSFV